MWVLLGAAEDGALDTARVAATQQRAANAQQSARPGAAGTGGAAVLTNELMSGRSAARFLTSLLSVGRDAISDDSRRAVVGNVCEAARINLQLGDGIDSGGDQIAQWLGVSHVLC